MSLLCIHRLKIYIYIVIDAHRQSLDPETSQSEVYAKGVVDLAVETIFLSVLTHPHIITLRAIGAEDMLSPKYFIVTDRLNGTLDRRIHSKWKTQGKAAKGVMSKLSRQNSGRLDELMEIKLKYAYDLMGAIEYLHKHR